MKDIMDFTDAELMAMAPEQRSALMQKYQEVLHQKQVYKLVAKYTDKELEDLRKTNPEDTDLIAQGRIPESLIKEESAPDIRFLSRWKLALARAKLKNFGEDFGSEGAPSALERVNEDIKDEFNSIRQDGRIFVQHKFNNDKNWYALDADPTTNLPNILKAFNPAGNNMALMPGELDDQEWAKKPIDWKKEKKNFFEFFKDIPYDLADVMYDSAAGIGTTYVGVQAALLGVPLGIPLVAASLGTSFANGLLEGTRQTLGNFLYDKKVLNKDDILLAAGTGGLLTLGFGQNIASKYLRKKLAPEAQRIAEQSLPMLKQMADPSIPLKDLENQKLIDLGYLGVTPEQAREQIISNYENELVAKTMKKTKGLVPAAYDMATREAAINLGSFVSNVPRDAYVHFFRNPARMLELDDNATRFAKNVGDELKDIAVERNETSGARFGDYLTKNADKQVDLRPILSSLKDRMGVLEQKGAEKKLNQNELTELEGLQDVYKTYFFQHGYKKDQAKAVDLKGQIDLFNDKYSKQGLSDSDAMQFQDITSQYDDLTADMNLKPVERNLVMTPEEAKNFKNEFNEYARWDADIKSIEKEGDKKKIQTARKIYGAVNDQMDLAFSIDKKTNKKTPEAVQELRNLRKNNESAQRANIALNNLFPQESGGDLVEFQNAWNVLSSPDAKKNIALSDFINNIDKSKGLKGPDSYLQKMNDLNAHSYLGKTGSGGYNRAKDGQVAASLFGSIVAGVARLTGGSGQIGYASGKSVGLGLMSPEHIKASIRGAKTTEEFMGQILNLTGRKKELYSLPVQNLEMNIAAPQISSAWNQIANPVIDDNTTNYIEQVNY